LGMREGGEEGSGKKKNSLVTVNPQHFLYKSISLDRVLLQRILLNWIFSHILVESLVTPKSDLWHWSFDCETRFSLVQCANTHRLHVSP
jgi:hypothetical protein